MPFAIAMTLVVLVSSLVLLYQFTSGELGRDAEEVPDAPSPFRPDRPAFSGIERPSFSASDRRATNGRPIDSAA